MKEGRYIFFRSGGKVSWSTNAQWWSRHSGNLKVSTTDQRIKKVLEMLVNASKKVPVIIYFCGEHYTLTDVRLQFNEQSARVCPGAKTSLVDNLGHHKSIRSHHCIAFNIEMRFGSSIQGHFHQKPCFDSTVRSSTPWHTESAQKKMWNIYRSVSKIQ